MQTEKIDLAKIALVALWLRREQKERPKSISNLFAGLDADTATALETLPKLVEALQELHAAYAWSKVAETPQQTAALDKAYLLLKPFQP